MKKQRGFSLIELMIVLAIIAILSSIAVPAYQDYAVRSRVSELAILASSSKAVVAENIANNGGVMPADACVGVGVSASTRNTVDVSCTGEGVVTVTGDPVLASGTVLTYTPSAGAIDSSVGVTWRCQGSGSAEKYYPPDCR